jgi:hypothetical protein
MTSQHTIRSRPAVDAAAAALLSGACTTDLVMAAPSFSCPQERGAGLSVLINLGDLDSGFCKSDESTFAQKSRRYFLCRLVLSYL